MTAIQKQGLQEISAYSPFEDMPNEVIKMFLEHLSPQQRIAIARISQIWCYLGKSFPIIRESYI